MNNDHKVLEWVTRVTSAEKAAHQALAQHEQSPSRVIILEQLLNQLSGLPVDVQDYFREPYVPI